MRKSQLAKLLLATTSLCLPSAVMAQTVSANGQTQVYTAPNGVQVVDIAKASQSGLSHNKFDQYNVPDKGLVLNNGTRDQISRQSQLAGQVVANLNLDQAAKVILNEVVSANRTTMTGYTEVVGSAASVIVANPYGVTCGGCGFINTPNVQIVTGRANVDGQGNLQAFAITGGDILITGTGLDASGQDYLALVARKVDLEAQINANELDVVAGLNDWDSQTMVVTGHRDGDDSPDYAIDSSALGGMYANRIRLIATEAGVGVRALGDVAATGGDFTIDSAGKIQLAGKASAQRDIRMTASGGHDIALDKAALTAAGDIDLSADGALMLTGGSLVAQGDLALTAASLSDSAATSDIADANRRAAGKQLSVGVNGGAQIDGTVYSGETGLDVDAASLTIGAGGARFSSNADASLTTTGAMALVKASVRAADDLSLTAGGLLSTVAGSDQAILSTGGEIALTANGIANAGSVSAEGGDIIVKSSGSVSNSGTLQADGALSIDALGLGAVDITNSASGKMLSNGAMTISGGAGVGNQGQMLTGGALTLDGTAMTNSGTLQAASGAEIDVDTLVNSGTIIGSGTGSGGANVMTLTADSVTNTGTLQSGGDLTLALADTLTNSGKILGEGKVTLDATGTGLDIANQASGGIYAGGELNVSDAGTAFTDQSGVLRGGTLNIALASLTNNGTIQSDGGGTVAIAGALTNNSGKLIYLGAQDGTTSTLSAGSVDNDGTLQSSGDLTLKSGGAITNRSGAKMLTNGDLNVAGTDIGTTLTNGGTIRALGALDISGVNNGGLTLVHGQADSMTAGGTVDIKAGTLTLDDKGSGSDGGGLASDGNMTLDLGTLNMAGLYSYITAASGGTGLANISINGPLTNRGLIYSGDDLTIGSTSIANNSGGALAAGGMMTLNSSGDIANYGSLYTGEAMNLNAGYTVKNYRYAAISSDGAITASANKFVNSSNVNAKGNITITANEFRNEVEGGDTRAWSYAGTGFDSSQPDGDQDNRTGANTENHSAVLGWSASNYNTSHEHNDTTWWWRANFYVTYDFAGGVRPDYNPMLVSDGTMTIREFQNAYNLGGIVSATTLNISSSKSGAQFTNDNLSSLKQNWYAEWNHYDNCNAVTGGSCNYTAYRSYDKRVTSTETTNSVGGGIYAGTLNASGFALTNAGSAYNATTTPSNASGGPGDAQFVSGAADAAGAGLTSIDFVGISIPLPTSPNGQFVVAKDPASKYLVETNPRYTGAGGGIGSDFIAERLGINPDDLTRRLGDASYEAYLIQQQSAGQTGAAVLQRGETNDQQVQRLMTSAADQAVDMGLTYGQALTPEQVANLKQDMVWMVETEVNGQTVLAPVVYLSEATKANFAKGEATIAADNANMDLTSLTNTGGTIEGSQTLSITSQGDITNTSGTIKGGDVALTSTGGSIINQTLVETTGETGNMSTDFGKTAGIESTGNLSLDANKDIAVSGANVTAGGDASLIAGEDISFTSIQDRNSGRQSIENGSQTTTTVTERGSGLTVGGNLDMDSGGDTTFKASNADIAGNADITTGGDFNILAGQNSTETVSETSRSGLGVGGGIWGNETTTTDEFSGRNVSSNFNVGGNLGVDSTGDMTVQGSNVNVGGNADVKADSVNILQGNDVDTKTTNTTTETYLRMSSGTESGTKTYADADASAGGLSAQASAGAGASASNSNQGNLELYNRTTTTETSDKSSAVGSSFNVGGNATIEANKDVTLQGSELNAGGDVDVDATNINLLAAQNKDITTSTTNSTSVGFMVDNNNTASADANASASASLTAQASAEAKVEAESDTTIDLVRNTQSSTTTTDITHTGSSITSGGNTSLIASDQLKVQGSSVDAGGDVDLAAKDMSFEAVNDVHEVSTTSQTTSAGLYVNGNAEAKAGAEANMLGASAGASAEAEAGAGIQVKHESSASVDGTTTAQTSSIKAGGNMTRTAENSITDVGTDIEAGGNFTQSAETWDSKAAADTTYGTSSSQTDTGRIGVFAEAEAGASA